MMTRLIPKVFFNQMSEGLDLFVGCLGFTVLYQDESMAVVERAVQAGESFSVDGVQLSPDEVDVSVADRPGLSVATDNQLAVGVSTALSPHEASRRKSFAIVKPMSVV